MSDEFRMSTGQAHELALAFGRNGWTNADVKRLSEGDVLARVLPFIREPAEQKLAPPPPLLTLAGTITVRPATKFVAREFFTKKNKAVKISYRGDNFTAWLLDKTEERTEGEIALLYYTLNKGSLDAAIITELGGELKAETTLAVVANLMAKQASGESGALLTNGYANIFYVRDASGVLRAVNVCWSGDCWRVYASSVEGPFGWGAVVRVFSRDS